MLFIIVSRFKFLLLHCKTLFTIGANARALYQGNEKDIVDTPNGLVPTIVFTVSQGGMEKVQELPKSCSDQCPREPAL